MKFPSPSPVTEEKIPVILYSSRMKHCEGAARLLHTLKHILAEREVKLIMTGEGSCLSEMKEIADEIGVAPNVEFRGNVTQNELRMLYKKADAYVHPATISGASNRCYHENAILTALAFHLPVIACGFTKFLRTLATENAGLLVRTGDCEALAQYVLRALEDTELCEEMDQNAHEHRRELEEAHTGPLETSTLVAS